MHEAQLNWCSLRSQALFYPIHAFHIHEVWDGYIELGLYWCYAITSRHRLWRSRTFLTDFVYTWIHCAVAIPLGKVVLYVYDRSKVEAIKHSRHDTHCNSPTKHHCTVQYSDRMQTKNKYMKDDRNINNTNTVWENSLKSEFRSYPCNPSQTGNNYSHKQQPLILRNCQYN